jgi:hypothetical protein
VRGRGRATRGGGLGLPDEVPATPGGLGRGRVRVAARGAGGAHGGAWRGRRAENAR